MSESASMRKEAIYRAAARLFREKGFAATNMRELAQAVGLEASSLYSHISSKTDLLDHICFAAAERFTRGMASILEDHPDPLARIRALIRLHADIALDDPTSQTVFSDEWRHLPPERLEAFLTLRRDYERHFLEILVAAQQEGLIRPLPPRVILLTMLSALGWLYRDAAAAQSRDRAALGEQLSQILLDGIRS